MMAWEGGLNVPWSTRTLAPDALVSEAHVTLSRSRTAFDAEDGESYGERFLWRRATTGPAEICGPTLAPGADVRPGCVWRSR